MVLKDLKLTGLSLLLLATGSMVLISSCSEDDDAPPPLKSKEIDYQFHNGQTVESAAYAGVHPATLSAKMLLEELANGNTKITITLENTLDGEIYNIHAHDAADPASTPSGTPYNETPNADILAQSITGNGNNIAISQEAKASYNELISSYEGFFVVHDPLQSINTKDIGTFLIVSSFAREQTSVSFRSKTFDYDFNSGQLAQEFAYNGTHPDNLSASITVDELSGNQSRIVVRIMNTSDGQTYHTHAHDAGDPASTPNGTPYNESPNAEVFVAPIAGNGGTSSHANISSFSYEQITSTYEGFFVVHDPLQSISTADPTTFVILGTFARNN